MTRPSPSAVTDEGLVERSEIIAAFEKDDEMHRRLFSCTLAQEAETRAAYLEAYANTVSKAMYAGERPSGIWNLEAAAKMLRQQAAVIEALRIETSGHTALVREIEDLRAFKARVLAAVQFDSPVATDDAAIQADLADGLSLRKCAAKHGLTFGQVRGAARRAALSRPLAERE